MQRAGVQGRLRELQTLQAVRRRAGALKGGRPDPLSFVWSASVLELTQVWRLRPVKKRIDEKNRLRGNNTIYDFPSVPSVIGHTRSLDPRQLNGPHCFPRLHRVQLLSGLEAHRVLARCFLRG